MSQINKTQPCECVHRSHEDKPKEGGGEVAPFFQKVCCETIHYTRKEWEREKGAAGWLPPSSGLMVDSVGEVVG